MALIYRNLKNRKPYKVIETLLVNMTNDSNDKYMVLYKDEKGKKFVRERTEFYAKFEKTNLNKL